MPLYEYECSSQHGVFEVTQSIKDPPLETCPECDAAHLKSLPPKRLISKTTFQLVGGSWASTGYK